MNNDYRTHYNCPRCNADNWRMKSSIIPAVTCGNCGSKIRWNKNNTPRKYDMVAGWCWQSNALNALLDGAGVPEALGYYRQNDLIDLAGNINNIKAQIMLEQVEARLPFPF